MGSSWASAEPVTPLPNGISTGGGLFCVWTVCDYFLGFPNGQMVAEAMVICGSTVVEKTCEQHGNIIWNIHRSGMMIFFSSHDGFSDLEEAVFGSTTCRNSAQANHAGR